LDVKAMLLHSIWVDSATTTATRPTWQTHLTFHDARQFFCILRVSGIKFVDSQDG
jgi:hypothetical protein